MVRGGTAPPGTMQDTRDGLRQALHGAKPSRQLGPMQLGLGVGGVLGLQVGAGVWARVMFSGADPLPYPACMIARSCAGSPDSLSPEAKHARAGLSHWPMPEDRVRVG